MIVKRMFFIAPIYININNIIKLNKIIRVVLYKRYYNLSIKQNKGFITYWSIITFYYSYSRVIGF